MGRAARSMEHEPVDKAEWESFDLDEAAGKIREALRPAFRTSR